MTREVRPYGYRSWKQLPGERKVVQGVAGLQLLCTTALAGVGFPGRSLQPRREGSSIQRDCVAGVSSAFGSLAQVVYFRHI